MIGAPAANRKDLSLKGLHAKVDALSERTAKVEAKVDMLLWGVPTVITLLILVTRFIV